MSRNYENDTYPAHSVRSTDRVIRIADERAAKLGPPTPLVLAGVFALVMICALLWGWGWMQFGNQREMVSIGSTSGVIGIQPSRTPFQPNTNTPMVTATYPPDPTAYPTFTPTSEPTETEQPTQTEWPTATETQIPTLTNTPLPSPSPTSLAMYLQDEYDRLALSRAKRNNVLAWMGTILLGVLVLVIGTVVLAVLVRHWLATWRASAAGVTTLEDVQAAVTPEDRRPLEAIALLEAAVIKLGEGAARATRQIPGHRDLAGWGFDRWQAVTDYLVSLGLCYKQSGGASPGTYFKNGSVWVWLYVADMGRLAEPGIVNRLPTPPE